MVHKKGRIIGSYNELRYTIEHAQPSGEITPLYEAGNSPFDSQVYVPAPEGVGLQKMKAYCEVSARQFARELKLPFGGIQYEPSEQEETI